MITDKQAIEAARILKEYCDKVSCRTCLFNNDCLQVVPALWELPDTEPVTIQDFKERNKK